VTTAEVEVATVTAAAVAEPETRERPKETSRDTCDGDGEESLTAGAAVGVVASIVRATSRSSAGAGPAVVRSEVSCSAAAATTDEGAGVVATSPTRWAQRDPCM
jgi:hypothetical protein